MRRLHHKSKKDFPFLRNGMGSSLQNEKYNQAKKLASDPEALQMIKTDSF